MAGEEMLVMFIAFIISAAFAAIFFILCVLFAAWTPALTFFRARLKRNPMLAMYRRDRKIDFCQATYTEGMAICEKYKTAHIIDPDSAYVEKKSGVTILLTHPEIGVTFSPGILGIFDALRKKKNKDGSIVWDNIEEAEIANACYGQCSCGYEGIMKPVVEEKHGVKAIVGLTCPYSGGETHGEGEPVEEAEGDGREDAGKRDGKEEG